MKKPKKLKNTAPVPHCWSKDALLTKAQQYAEEMLSFPQDEWRFVLWSTLTLELLARAALSNQSQALLADSKDRDNIIHAVGLKVKTKTFVPKSINISEVFARLNILLPDFVADLQRFSIHHMARRNEEVHSGTSPFDGLKTSSWLPQYYEACDVLLTSMGESLDLLVGEDHAEAAKELIAASKDKTAKAILQYIDACKLTWEAKPTADRTKLSAQADVWATKQEGHRVKCPACSCEALITGEASSPALQKVQDEEVIVTQQFLPSKFECIACGLKISGLPQLTASGLGDTYKATFTYDAAEFYMPEDPYDGYEPDYNEP